MNKKNRNVWTTTYTKTWLALSTLDSATFLLLKEFRRAWIRICWLLNFTPPWIVYKVWYTYFISSILHIIQFTCQVTFMTDFYLCGEVNKGTVLQSSHLSLSKHCETECSIASIKLYIVPDLFRKLQNDMRLKWSKTIDLFHYSIPIIN